MGSNILEITSCLVLTVAKNHTVYDLNQVTEWHKKMEETRLQELRKGRELVVQKEEIKYLWNLVKEQEQTIHSLEEDIVQQKTVSEKLILTHTQICSFFNHYKIQILFVTYTVIHSIYAMKCLHNCS